MTDAEFVAALLAGQQEMRALAMLLGCEYQPEAEAVLRARWGVERTDDEL